MCQRPLHKSNVPSRLERHQNYGMDGPLRSLAATMCALALSGPGVSTAQGVKESSPPAQAAESRQERGGHRRTLTKEDRSSVLAVALHAKKPRHPGHDCSHLVHDIYAGAGFPYSYADSDDLYEGAKGFRRVSQPQPADLVVWHGHVGIVVRPSKHEFFSMLSTGPGIDDYRSRYWKTRGQPRFYRYVSASADR